jgi:glutaredoxin-related protein
MLKIYGSMMCPDCVACREDLDRAGVAYEYLDFSDSLLNLKEFLKLRQLPEFDQVKENGSIGIPCILREDGSVTLDWSEYVS